MKTLSICLAIILLASGGIASACYDCASIVQPAKQIQRVEKVVVEYAAIQPQLVRETTQFQRQEYHGEPVIVERQERVVERVHGANQGLLQKQVQHIRVEQLNVKHGRVQQRQQSQQYHAPAAVIQFQVRQPQKVTQKVETKVGLFGRIRQQKVTSTFE